jgi:hypothetical protein
MAGFKGGCLCGAVRYHSQEDPIVTINCHCDDCRRSTGAVFSTNVMVPEDRLLVEGETRQYEHGADSGNIMTKSFCPTCGALLFGTSSGRHNIVSIRAGTIDDPRKITPSVNVYLDRRIPTTVIDEGLVGWQRMPANKPWETS